MFQNWNCRYYLVVWLAPQIYVQMGNPHQLLVKLPMQLQALPRGTTDGMGVLLAPIGKFGPLWVGPVENLYIEYKNRCHFCVHNTWHLFHIDYLKNRKLHLLSVPYYSSPTNTIKNHDISVYSFNCWPVYIVSKLQMITIFEYLKFSPSDLALKYVGAWSYDLTNIEIRIIEIESWRKNGKHFFADHFLASIIVMSKRIRKELRKGKRSLRMHYCS